MEGLAPLRAREIRVRHRLTLGQRIPAEFAPVPDAWGPFRQGTRSFPKPPWIAGSKYWKPQRQIDAKTRSDTERNRNAVVVLHIGDGCGRDSSKRLACGLSGASRRAFSRATLAALGSDTNRIRPMRI